MAEHVNVMSSNMGNTVILSEPVPPFKRTIEDKEIKKLETLIQTTITKPELVQTEIRKTELETRRDIQRDDGLDFVKTCKK